MYENKLDPVCDIQLKSEKAVTQLNVIQVILQFTKPKRMKLN